MCANCEDCTFKEIQKENNWHEIHITCTNVSLFRQLCEEYKIKYVIIDNLDFSIEAMTSVKFKGSYEEALEKAADLWNKLLPANPIRKKLETMVTNKLPTNGYYETHIETPYSDYLLSIPNSYVSRNRNKTTCILTIRDNVDKLNNVEIIKIFKEFCWYDSFH